MQGETVPVVLIQRFTSYAGEWDYDTAPLDVTEFDRLVARFQRATPSDPVTVTFQDSHDCVTWFDLDDTDDAEADIRVNLTRRWLRVVVSVGAGQVVTCWCSGTLRRRVE